MKRILNTRVLLNAVAAVTLSESKLIEDYRHGVINVITTGFTGTIKVKISDQELPPDFSAASTPTNHWSYVDLKGRDDGGVTIVGVTGIVHTTDTSNASFAINTDSVRWVAVHVEARAAGSVSVLLSAANND